MNCIPREIDFIVRDNDANMRVVEDDIREDLARIGITVNTTFLGRDDYIAAERNGNYHMLLTRTWGAPYDPHTYLNSWAVPSHVEYSAIGGLDEPLSREDLLNRIKNVQRELNVMSRAQQWREILQDIHQEAIFLPLWGSRIPYVINRRLDGFVAPPIAFIYPLANVRVQEGTSTTVTVAPGSGGSLFKTIGPMNPHQYSPNQIFINNWIYEGLVTYGHDGVIGPGLATSWDVEPTEQGQRVTFQLREALFHDGTTFNCSVAKLNFDHVLAPNVRKRHSWFDATNVLSSWTCNANGEFVLETNTTFYPLLQELSYPRPLVFASAAAFAEGFDSDQHEHNSCRSGDFGSAWEEIENEVTCLGLEAPIGTGPFRFVNRTFLPGSDESIDQMVVFARHEDYWGGPPEIETLIIKHYETNEDVYNALASGELDMTLGNGPLTATQVRDISFFNSSDFDVVRSEVLQNAVLVLNTNRTPTDDFNVRTAIIHAIDKAEFINAEFAGLEQPVSELLPLTAPYSDVDLNPKWSFDLEKAMFLNCPEDTGDDGIATGAIVGVAVAAGVVILALVGLVGTMISREKEGKPMFSPEKVEEGEAS